MAMFANRTQLPGLPSMGGPGAYDMGVDPSTQQAVGQYASMPTAPAAPQETKIPGWKAALGGFLDGIAQQTGGQAAFVPAMQRRQEQQFEFQKLQQQQQAELQRQMALAQWKAANPDPTELQKNTDWLNQNHPDLSAQYLHRMTNDTVWRQGPDGQFYPVQTPQAQSLGASLPQGWTVQQGGASGNAGGGFRGP